MAKKIQDFIDEGLWPKSKKVTSEKGLSELEELGYNLFYIGKNADLYFKEGSQEILMVRTDRASVNDVKLSDTIEGKSKIQNQISNFGYDFAETLGINTARKKMPDDIPEKIAERSQYITLAKPMTIKLEDGTETGIEMIFRKYLTGSLYKAYKAGEDPYGLNLEAGLEEWHEFETPIFTPTTKGISDEPINHQYVRDQFPEEVKNLLDLFINAIDYLRNRGIILVDTKFEMFNGLLGDEILTPESSRFIKLTDFEAGKYISMDKQILRDAAKKYGWTDNVEKGDTANVVIPEETKEAVLIAYKTIYDMSMQELDS